MDTAQPEQDLTRFAHLSIVAALLVIALKAGAYLFTGSVGLLSDALESSINLVGAVVALIALTWAAKPPDEQHEFGHDKAEYFSSGVEGALIVVAAASIIWVSTERLLNPQPLEQVEVGLLIAMVASAINWGVARVLARAGQRHSSITLQANAQHLMTDVWTSVGVVVGVGAVALTGLTWLDPLIALLVALNILRSGVGLVRRSASGLMDSAIPEDERGALDGVLDRYKAEGITFHAVRTRQAGARRFVSMHVLVPGGWTVQRGHDLLEAIEREVRAAVPNTHITTHLEPLEDPAAWHDRQLDRSDDH